MAGFTATLFCVWLAIEGALKLRTREPGIITAAALFALNWAVLLLYYLPGPPQDEILASFSGFLLIYTGILLLRAALDRSASGRQMPVGWADRLPLYIFRTTVLGYGVYLAGKRLFRYEYGYGTLALALWGTLLTLLGYFSIWVGITYLHQGGRAGRRVCAGLGLLLCAYSGCELAYSVWYVRDFWPTYHRYLALQVIPHAPSLKALLPVDPQADWPQADRWRALESRRDWPQIRGVMAMQAQARVPAMPAWLEYAFSALKLVFCLAFVLLLAHKPERSEHRPRSRLVRWLDRRLHTGAL